MFVMMMIAIPPTQLPKVSTTISTLKFVFLFRERPLSDVMTTKISYQSNRSLTTMSHLPNAFLCLCLSPNPSLKLSLKLSQCLGKPFFDGTKTLVRLEGRISISRLGVKKNLCGKSCGGRQNFGRIFCGLLRKNFDCLQFTSHASESFRKFWNSCQHR